MNKIFVNYWIPPGINIQSCTIYSLKCTSAKYKSPTPSAGELPSQKLRLNTNSRIIVHRLFDSWLKSSELNDISVVLRVLCQGQRYYSKSYGRMKKKICHVVMFEHEQYKMGTIQYFVLNKIQNNVFAIIQPMTYFCLHQVTCTFGGVGLKTMWSNLSLPR